MGDADLIPEIRVHDVLQSSRFTNYQRKMRINADTIEKLFYENMEDYSDIPMELSILAEGIPDHPEWVSYIKQRPKWRVCCHGIRHIRYDCLPPEQCRQELSDAKNIIEDTFGTKVTTYIPPFNKYNDTTREIAASLGMEELRKYRKFSNYINDIGKCLQYDYHYWDWRNVNALKTIIRHDSMKPPVIIIGAPRSGTTAYMRYTAQQMPDYLPLKEHERFWQVNSDRRASRLKGYYAKQLINTDKVGIIDKNVRNTFRILKIQAVYPKAQFIFIYRNPRGAISSWREWAIKTKKDDTSIEGAAHQYLEYVSFWLKHRDRLNNWKEERYERLCDGTDYFKSCDFKWQRRLTASDLKVIDEIVKPIIKEIGYE